MQHSYSTSNALLSTVTSTSALKVSLCSPHLINVYVCIYIYIYYIYIYTHIHTCVCVCVW